MQDLKHEHDDPKLKHRSTGAYSMMRGLHFHTVVSRHRGRIGCIITPQIFP